MDGGLVQHSSIFRRTAGSLAGGHDVIAQDGSDHDLGCAAKMTPGDGWVLSF
jgi:hypothetical protein